MELTWLQSLILGLISGFAEILPVSAQAHRLLGLKMFGTAGEPPVLRFMIHAATVGALYFCCHGQIVRMMRAQRLSRIPKKRRKRPLDLDAMADFSLLRTALVPILLSAIVYSKAQLLAGNLLWVAALLLFNGIILYIPQYLPGANKSSPAMNRIDSLIYGLGGAAAILPGVSGLGTALALASIRGMDLKKSVDLGLVMLIPVNLMMACFDFVAMIGAGSGSLSFGALFGAVLSGCATFVGIILAIRLLQKITQAIGFSVFGFYSWGAALLTFIIYLSAV